MTPLKEKFTLRQWRVMKGIKLNKLSVETGLTERTLYNFEHDINALRGTSFRNLETIAGALEISVDDIFLSPTSEKPKFT